MRYRAEVDGLRALAVVPVILFHAGIETFKGGYVGVDVFFVISGYLITTILLNELNSGSFSIAHFYERRARRILPALFLVIFASLPFAWFWLLPEDMKSFSQSIVSVPFFSSNILFWHQTGYFDTSTELKPLIHTWSLAVEEQFYLLFPLFLLLTWRLGKKTILVALTFIFAISLAAAQWGAYHQPSFTFFMLPTRAWELAVGAFIAFYYTEHNIKHHKDGLAQWASLLGLLLILYSVLSFSKVTPFPSLYALTPTLGAALIIIFATHRTWTGKLLGSKPFVGIGLISYSAYLWHQPMFAFARHRTINETSLSLMLTLGIMSFIFAYLSWRFVERPFRNKHKFTAAKVAKYAIIFGSILLITGAIGILTNGNYYRYNNEQMTLIGNDDENRAYVWGRKNKNNLADFDNTAPYKILLIGDSSSGDLLNALHEANIDKSVSISSYTINSGCGNLFLENTAFEKEISSDRRGVCSSNRRYNDQKLDKLIRQASTVMLASNWMPWELQLIDESLARLNTKYGKKFFVFGSKSIEFNKRHLLTHVTASPPTSQPTEKGRLTNESLSKIKNSIFINPYDYLCNTNTCPLFDDQGNPIYFDGFHLTRAGAKYFGNRLKSNNKDNLPINFFSPNK